MITPKMVHRRRVDHAGGAIIEKPADLVEHPDQEKLCRQRGDRQVKTLDT